MGVGVILAEGVAVGVIVGFLVGEGEVILLVTVAIGVIEILGISVGVISSIIGVGVIIVSSSLGVDKNKLKGEELILNIKKTPITDKISRTMVKTKYLVFLESIV